MQPQQNPNGGEQSAEQRGAVVCSQCGAPMPPEMRFCRACGNRLGEGPAEYTETVRFPNARTASRNQGTTPFAPATGAPMVQQTGSGLPGRRRRPLGGMAWIFIVIAIFFAGGTFTSLMRKGRIHPPRVAVRLPERSYFGVDEFSSANGGVTFGDVEPPGSPADLAGLVGGDLITSFDGHPVKDEDQMMDLLRQTPMGKTVEVIYLRDGETKKTQLTTISRDENNQLERAYKNRPEGKGHLGFDDDYAKRVAIPGTKMYGVQLNNIERNEPADIAGIRKGDIVIEFDGVPIRTVEELVARDHRTIPYTTVKVAVMRGNERVEIPVKLGKQ